MTPESTMLGMMKTLKKLLTGDRRLLTKGFGLLLLSEWFGDDAKDTEEKDPTTILLEGGVKKPKL